MIRCWKDIKDYDGKYKISNYGEVVSLPRFKNNHNKLQEVPMKKITPYINNKNGYVYVYLCNNGKYKNIRLHRLVANNFIENPNNYNQVNHIDGNKLNNRVDNLEWCSSSYNIKDMYRRNEKYKKDNEIVQKYKELKSCNKVAKFFNMSGENIRQILIRNNIERARGGINEL